jgi:hypothetical protein
MDQRGVEKHQALLSYLLSERSIKTRMCIPKRVVMAWFQGVDVQGQYE